MIKFSMGEEVIEDKHLLPTHCATFDMNTASFHYSHTGHVVVNCGVSSSTGYVGPGNSFKSKLMNFFAMSAYKFVLDSGLNTQLFTEDTEVNMSLAHLAHLLSLRLNRIVTVDELKTFWSVTDKTMHSGDEWARLLRQLGLQIIKEDKKIEWYLFGNKDKVHQDYVPRIVTLDSLTELEPAITEEMINKSTKEDSSTNMVFMKKGLFKTKFLSELPKMITKPNIRFLTTAHLGAKIEMDPNAKYKQPTKDLMFLKEGEVIKGVSSKFLFLISLVFSSSKSQKFINRSDKGPEYPAPDAVDTEVDLQLVHLQILRNKHGASGTILPVVVSQADGVQGELTDFKYIRGVKEEPFGFEGNLINFRLLMLPDVALSRKKLRPLLMQEDSTKLKRAIYLTASLKYIKKVHLNMVSNGTYMEPTELLAGLDANNYSIDKILELASPVYTIVKTEVPYLSIIDMLLMAQNKSELPTEYLEQFKK